jgi:hypothetical protein
VDAVVVRAVVDGGDLEAVVDAAVAAADTEDMAVATVVVDTKG